MIRRPIAHHHETSAPLRPSPARRPPSAPLAHPGIKTRGRTNVGTLDTVRWRFAALRLVLGAAWLADGFLELQPGVFHSFHDLVQQSAANQPAALQLLIGWGAGLLAHAPTLANGALGAVEVLIGLALLLGVGTRHVLVASMLLVVPIWVLGEGLGQVFTGNATDIGAAPLYALLAIAILLGRGWQELNLIPALASRLKSRSGDDDFNP